jgi:class 3 adenylate cyclase
MHFCSYMVLCGHDGETDHALRVLRTARDMIALTNAPLAQGEKLRVRIGLNTGPAHSGVLGTKRLKFTVWGDRCVLGAGYACVLGGGKCDFVSLGV